MNTNELSQVVASILQRSADAIGNGVEKGIAVAGEQLPQLASEYIRWRIFDSGFRALTSLIVLSVSGYLVSRCILRRESDVDVYMPTYMFGGAALLFSAFCFFSTAIDTSKAILAPRIVLIEAGINVANGRGLK